MQIVCVRDLVQSVKFLVLWPISWFLPTRYWPACTRWLGRMHVRFLGNNSDRLKNVSQLQLGIDPTDLEIGYQQNKYRELLEILRDYAPWRREPGIAVVGRERIDEALAKGKGAVLWYCPCARADIIFKKGLFQAGYRINHLSASTHGYSSTRFGMALLNPIKTRVENRYLKERCVIHFGSKGVGAVIRSLLDRLRANELVSVTALASGTRYGERELLGGTVRLAKGAPNFALTTGAALIPVFVVPVKGGYQVRVEPELVATSDIPETAEEEFISNYIPVLKRYVLAHPDIWDGWTSLPDYWNPGERATRVEPDL